MSDALPLPPRPNLEQYKNLARDLQAVCKSSGAIREWATRWVEALARLEGSSTPPTPRERERQVEILERDWNRLLTKKEHAASCTLASAQFFIARAHGFTSWPKFASHIREINQADSEVSAFEAAADAVIRGDTPTLRKLLDAHRGLAQQGSTREHHSTLLHYVSANGIEDFRQKTPQNIVEITNVLLDAGVEVNAESDAYGGGCTALGLVATSIHPEKAGVQIALLRTLLDRGATFMQTAIGGNRQSIVNACLANGQPAAARFFADLGAPLNLEGAAALGRMDALRECFDENGAPPLEAKQIESAFIYACGYGSREAAEFLLDRGVDPSSRNEAGETALHWANYGPHLDVIRLLLARGASVDAKDDRHHSTPLDMALWTWDHTSDTDRRERCYDAVALLVRAGARLDRNQWKMTEHESSAILRNIDSDERMTAALRDSPMGLRTSRPES